MVILIMVDKGVIVEVYGSLTSEFIGTLITGGLRRTIRQMSSFGSALIEVELWKKTQMFVG
jgi:hypothetical protein